MSCVTKWKSLNYQMRFLSYAQAKDQRYVYYFSLKVTMQKSLDMERFI